MEGESDKSISWKTFSAPLEWRIWITALLTFAVGSIGMILTVESQTNDSGYLISFYSFLVQGFPDEITNISSRIVFLSLYVAGMMFWFAYSATLISILAAKSDKFPFTTLTEMISNTNYKVVTQSGSANFDVFKVFS